MKTTFVLAVSGLASAGQIANPFFQPRQIVEDQSFTVSPGASVICEPPNIECGAYCVFPSRGQICCPELYPCGPRNGVASFCLTDNKCCPEGEDPTTCARREGVSLPPGFQVGGTYQSASPSASGSASASASVSLPTLSTSIETDTGAPTFSVSLPTLSTSIPVGTGTGTGTGAVPTATATSTAPIVPFTGAAGRVGAGRFGGMVVALVVGIGAWIV